MAQRNAGKEGMGAPNCESGKRPFYGLTTYQSTLFYKLVANVQLLYAYLESRKKTKVWEPDRAALQALNCDET